MEGYRHITIPPNPRHKQLQSNRGPINTQLEWEAPEARTTNKTNQLHNTTTWEREDEETTI